MNNNNNINNDNNNNNDAKIIEVKGEISNITSLATASSLTSVENKIHSVFLTVTITQKLMKLTKKITDHNHDKYITTPEFNKFMAELFVLRLK